MRRIALLSVIALTILSWPLTPPTAHAQAPTGNTPVKEVQIAADAFALGEPVPPWVESITIPDAAGADPLVLRLLDTQYLVGSTSVVYVRRALQINDAASLTRVGQVGIQFVPQYNQLKLHTLRVLRGGETLDRMATSAVRFLQRERGLEQGVYSGEVTASILVNDLRVGDTLEFSYSLHGHNPVMGARFVDGASWDQAYPTLLRRIVLSAPTDRRIFWRMIGERGAKRVVPKESVESGMRRLVFEEQSLPKVTPEPLIPPDYTQYRWMQFSEFAEWHDVALWANDLFQSSNDLNEDLRRVVETLRGMATDEERVVAALEFVQSQIRYFSVSIGESSHRPTQPEIVLQRRYGDCKDKSLLMLTLLRALGIQSRPVLLQAGRGRRPDNALPSPLLFNHAIVQVTLGGNVYYLDPTRLGQHGRLRRMGQVHEGADVLVVAPETRGLTTIATPNVRGIDRSEVTETASLPKFDSEGTLQVRQVWYGAIAEGLRVSHERTPRDQIVSFIGNALESRYPGAKMIGEPDFQDDRADNVFSITTSYSIPKLANEREGNWFVRYSPSNMKGALATASSSTRTVPLYQPQFPYDAKYAFEIKLPEEVSVVADPRTTTVKNKHFTYAVTQAYRGNVSKTTIQLATLSEQVPVADLKKYGEDVRSLANISVGVVAVPKGAIKPRLSARSAKKDVGQTVRDRLQETLDKTTQAIKSGKLAGADLAASYCLRSGAYSALGKSAEALADANEALKLGPNSSPSLYCRAYAYFGAAEFEKSVADYSKAITLGDTDSKTLHQRGIARFYAGKLDEAAEDFLRASETDDSEGQVTNDLWLTWTYKRLGKPLPEAVAARAVEQPRGEWPRPALAVLTGNMAPGDMLRLLERKTGDELTLGLSEGYFYLGQHYLGLGDKTKARHYFEETRRLNVLIYTEHTAAAFELQRLRASTETGALPQNPIEATMPPPVSNATTGDPASPPAANKSAPMRSRPSTQPWNKDIWKQ